MVRGVASRYFLISNSDFEVPNLFPVRSSMLRDQFVFARFDVWRHVDHVDEEVITTLARADIRLHGEDLLDDAFTLGVADFVSPSDPRLVAFANPLARNVLEFAVEEYLLLGFEAIFIEFVGRAESIDLGAEDWWAD